MVEKERISSRDWKVAEAAAVTDLEASLSAQWKTVAKARLRSSQPNLWVEKQVVFPE